MNANELAQYLEEQMSGWSTDLVLGEAATMLRQQQEQINNLKQWEKRQLDVIEALKAENKQLTEWLTKVGFVK
jgi:hypothetical protein